VKDGSVAFPALGKLTRSIPLELGRFSWVLACVGWPGWRSTRASAACPRLIAFAPSASVGRLGHLESCRSSTPAAVRSELGLHGPECGRRHAAVLALLGGR